jgi:L-arabinose isomerase
MINFNDFEVWFITGSQHLYGQETLAQVGENAQRISNALNDHSNIPIPIKFKSVVTRPEEIAGIIREANSDQRCIGIITWMHTFSPAKMWIHGLKILNKPLVHLHTQFNRDIPWEKIDMDFMNLNQSAHGDREFGFMMSRLRKNRKIIVGHWQEDEVAKKLGNWCRVCAGWNDLQGGKFARIGDNMREVAVTEGDKVEAQLKLGFSVNGYGVGDLVKFKNQVSDEEVERLVQEYEDAYVLSEELSAGGNKRNSLLDAARIELGLRAFLKDGNFNGFTDTFENLHGLKQLPGISVQRLMADGYGFGGEGDWKTAALLRAMKVMGHGLPGGTSFMEDYTYHLHPEKMQVLGSHMLEICPTIAEGKPSCEVHPLSIGGKEDPVRLVFNVAAGEAINVSLMDMGNRLRLLLNEVRAVKPEHSLPNLPVARVLWEPNPNLKDAATAWILAGGSHHTVYSQSLKTELIEDFAEIADLELLVIDKNTNLRDFKNTLRWNEVYYHLF